VALAVGLNSVDPKHYGGWQGDLNACEADAADMSDIARSQDFKISSVLTKDATRQTVTRKIKEASEAVHSGDIFMISYSGHGGQLPDRNYDEPDAMDETWCLYDGQIVDDELFYLLSKFEKGVRILVFSDSCHSGSVTRMAYVRNIMDARTTNVDINHVKYRFMPRDITMRTYKTNKAFYDPILKNHQMANAENNLKASVILISGCQDNQYSQDGTFNGLFTSNLLAVWKDSKFRGGYRGFHKKIVGLMPPDQTPNYFVIGKPDVDFEKQKPFTI
jgi:hypothetical protein